MAAAGVESEALDAVDDQHLARRQVEDAGLALYRLFLLAQLFLLALRHADAVGGPLRVAGEGCLRPERHDLDAGGRSGHGDDAQLVVAVRSVDSVGEPLAVRRE